jgi:hypothetical protein
MCRAKISIGADGSNPTCEKRVAGRRSIGRVRSVASRIWQDALSGKMDFSGC